MDAIASSSTIVADSSEGAIPQSSGNVAPSARQPNPNLSPTLIVLGMAGSGKTTFVQRLTAHLHAKKTPPYVVNLDPAVRKVPYPINIDIRDTVKYKQVMKDYGLGPNGAILTSLNLFCTRFDQVVDLVCSRAETVPLTIVDTPGQIEAFTWSASGTIITEAFASSHPTADIVRPTFAQRWMKDFERFDEALEEAHGGYSNDLARSLSLVLDEFYSGLRSVVASATTGEGMDEVLAAVNVCAQEYRDQYIPMYAEMRRKKAEEEQTRIRMQEADKADKLASGVKEMEIGKVADSDDEE